jgi:peptidoglycan/LPS O-acetylase OafA/YrhL
MKLKDLASGRNNNLNLIRMLAALAVLVSHSFALSIGTPDAEPFRSSIDMTPGLIAVDVFFVASGFLVTASLLFRQSALEFVWARALRIFPALWVMMLLTVFALGVGLTTWPKSHYLTSASTYIYFVKCSTLVRGVVYRLPGVFDGNPCGNAVNGSLWTLPLELKMYAILVLVWLGLRSTRDFRLRLFQAVVILFAGISGSYLLVCNFNNPRTFTFEKLFYMFFAGASLYVLRGHVPISKWLFGLALLCLAVATCDKRAFFAVYVCAIPYLLVYLAYAPSGWIRTYNELGDYSYGMYLYAFPIQQSVAMLIPEVSVVQMVMISFVATVLVSVLSWHLVEQRALRLKAHDRFLETCKLLRQRSRFVYAR